MKRIPLVLAAAAVLAASVPGVAAAEPTAPSAPAVCGTRSARTFSDVALRSIPDATSPAVTVVPANSFVLMSDDSTAVLDHYGVGWIGVVVDGRSGYLSKKYAEGPWITKRACGDSTVEPLTPELRAKIVAEGL